MSSRWAFASSLGLVVLAWFPLVIMAGAALTDRTIRLPDGGTSHLNGIELALADRRLAAALAASIAVALPAGLLSTAIVAANLCAFRFASATLGTKSTKLAGAASLAALVVPDLALALGVVLVLGSFGLGPSFAGLVYAHTLLGCLVTLPLALSLTSRIPFTMESAAMDLGCTRTQAAWRVTVPSNRNILAAAFLVSLILSFEDFVLALFVTPPGTTTLPLYVASLVKFRRLPEANALGLGLTIVALATVAALYKLTGVQLRTQGSEGTAR